MPCVALNRIGSLGWLEIECSEIRRKRRSKIMFGMLDWQVAFLAGMIVNGVFCVTIMMWIRRKK